MSYRAPSLWIKEKKVAEYETATWKITADGETVITDKPEVEQSVGPSTTEVTIKGAMPVAGTGNKLDELVLNRTKVPIKMGTVEGGIFALDKAQFVDMEIDGDATKGTTKFSVTIKGGKTKKVG